MDDSKSLSSKEQSLQHDKNVCIVPSRLNLLHSTKYLISVDEIRRRLCTPERLTMTELVAHLRLSKSKPTSDTLKEFLNNHGLARLRSKHGDKQITRFTPLVEGEAQQLAHDFGDIIRVYYPRAKVATHVVNSLAQNSDLVSCSKKIFFAREVIQNFIEFHSITESVYCNEQGVAESTGDSDEINAALYNFSAMTHSFGCPAILNVLQLVDDILEIAFLATNVSKEGPMDIEVANDQY